MKETKFKDTILGKIPEDWDLDIIDNLASITTGAQNTQDKSDNGKYPFFVRSQQVERINKYIFDTEGVITAGDGVGTGKIFHYINGKFGLHQRCYLIYNFKRIDAKYFYRVFSECFYDRVMSMTAKTSVDSVRREMISDMYIKFPKNIAEQTRIATALSDIDSLIESLGKLIQKKRNIKQGAMQELLTGKKRLKGFEKPWVERTIGELGNLTGAGVDKKSYHDETPVRLVNYIDVFHKDFIYNNELDFWVTANDQKLVQCNVKKGDVFFTPSSEMPYDIAFSAVAMEDMENVCYSYHIYRLRFNEDIDLMYRTYMFKTYNFYYQANQTCEGSGKRYVISLNKFKEMKAFYPSDKSEQTAIARILSDMDKEIEALEAKQEKYKSIKEGMMQELLSGRIRLV